MSNLKFTKIRSFTQKENLYIWNQKWLIWVLFEMALEKAIWNEDPQICNSSKLYVNTYKKKKLSIWDQRSLIWVFLGWSLKKLLSCLKSAPLNLRKWKLYCKKRTLNLGAKMSYLGILGIEFGNTEFLFTLIKAIQVE